MVYEIKVSSIDLVFSISNEIYMDHEGNNYENIGVPVNHELNYSRDRQTFFRRVLNDLDAFFTLKNT